MPVELKVPSAGESVTEVQIGAWRKAEGDFVERDEIIVEIETDKATMELPAPVAGVIARITKKSGSAARVGDVIGLLDEKAAAARARTGPAKAGAPAASMPAQSASRATERSPAAQPASGPGERIMPAARRVLGEQGIDPAAVRPTGPGGRVLKEDALRHVDGARPDASGSGEPGQRPSAAAPATNGPPTSAGHVREEEAVPMTTLRRKIAERLVEAQHNAALLTTFNEIDMSAVFALRKERGEAFEKRYGVKLGFMSFFVKAAVDALKFIPAVNGEIRHVAGEDGRSVPHIVYKNYFDIGVAVSTEQGLVVPVIRSAERLSFAEIEQAIGDLATRSRAKKLALEELQGGTFTISNGGVFGSLLSTPILNPPQSGILGLHAIQERPVVRDGQIVIRPMMYVALTYDHRIVDGRESVTFLKRIKECVEEPTRMLIEV